MNNILSDDFCVETGVPQGSVLSPFLYSIFIEGLRIALIENGLGTVVLGRLVPILLYADDIVLLASSSQELQKMLDVANDYACKWRFKFNTSKSNVVVMTKSKATYNLYHKHRCSPMNTVYHRCPSLWHIGESNLGIANEYKYLGVEMGKLGRGRWNSLMNRLWTKARERSNLITWVTKGKSGLRPRTAIHLWNTMVRPILEYGDAIWEGEVSNKWITKFESLHCSFLKTILGVHSSTANAGIRRECKAMQLKFRRQKHRLLFWARLCEAPTDSLRSVLFKYQVSQAKIGLAKDSWVHRSRDVLTQWNLRYVWDSVISPADWDNTLNSTAVAISNTDEDANLSCLSSLLIFNTLDTVTVKNFPCYLDDRTNLAGTWLKTLLRLNSLDLMSRLVRLGSNTSKFDPDSLSAAICPLCRCGIEDISHFLQTCRRLAPIRTSFFSSLKFRLLACGEHGATAWKLFDNGGLMQLQLMLGSSINTLSLPERTEIAWIFDHIMKQFFAKLWRVRTQLIGSFRIITSRGNTMIKHLPPAFTATANFVCNPSLGEERDWKNWMPNKPFFDWSNTKTDNTMHNKKNKSSFYTVWRGTVCGVFYRWIDCWRAIKNHCAPKFKGFATMEEAYAAYNNFV